MGFYRAPISSDRRRPLIRRRARRRIPGVKYAPPRQAGSITTLDVAEQFFLYQVEIKSRGLS